MLKFRGNCSARIDKHLITRAATQPSLPETLYTAPDFETTEESGNGTLYYAADVNVGRRYSLVKLRKDFSIKSGSSTFE
jgi:hypothetical protein